MGTEPFEPAEETWLGGEPGPHEPFNGGELWFGRHAADQDILVFDPAETDPCAARLSLYSLTQCRMRTFSREVVQERVHGLTERAEIERANREYRDRAAGRLAHERAAAVAETERRELQRRSVVDAHRRRLAGLGLEYAGVAPLAEGRRAGRRSRCHACGIEVDDFSGAVCLRCDEVLCSCGACACGGPSRGRRTRRDAAAQKTELEISE